MQIFDLHVHTARGGKSVSPEAYVSALAAGGIYGSAVFSPPAAGMHRNTDGLAFEERLGGILDFCKGYPGRLFPVLWIHPQEDGALAKADEAAARGIAGFKIICNNFYVGSTESMALLERAARLKKPVCFHSGILWDSEFSSPFNRPVNWEAMLDIPGLKFSLAHCSWPWYDECIALYGKLQHLYASKPDVCEMFFDLTPGTPEIYRRDLLTKLFAVGYDVKHNILFGTDCSTDYHPEWARKWRDIDDGIYDEIGVSAETRGCIYQDNFLRFMGASDAVHPKAELNMN